MCYRDLRQEMAAYSTYKRLTYDFPESKWAAYARAQLSQEKLLNLENKLELERSGGRDDEIDETTHACQPETMVRDGRLAPVCLAAGPLHGHAAGRSHCGIQGRHRPRPRPRFRGFFRMASRKTASALAFAAVKPWLTANPSSSQQFLFNGAKAAERAGDGSAAVSFYRKLLKNRSLDAEARG